MPSTLGVNVGAFWKNSVEVRREHDVRMRGGSGTYADHVADGIDADISRPASLKEASRFFAALLLMKRRCSGLADQDLFVDEVRLICGESLQARILWRDRL